METRKWLWKRKSSEKSPCETESSGSISSHSERYSDEQEAVKGSPDHNTQSPEVSSKAVARTEVVDESSLKAEDVNDSVKILTERLSAALVNVSAKEELVKQHAKVAEEAVAGWEKAENELAILKQQLEAAVQQKSALEDRVSHLDGALKECVRQLRQAKDEQEQKIHEAVSLKTLEWESTKCILESKLLELRNKAEFSSARVDPEICLKLEFLEKENSALRLEIHDQMEELEVRTIERDLSTQAAETASKQHLESIKKVAKLEAECRRLKAMACKSPLGNNDHKSIAASSTYVESFTDSHSNSAYRLNSLDSNKRELHHSDLSASALIAEFDQFKNEKNVKQCLPNCSIEINLMDDFLEMERLAALQPTESSSNAVESESKSRESVLRTELHAMTCRAAELEQKLAKLETEKAELEACKSNNEVSVLREELEASMRRTIELEVKLKRLEEEKAELENESGLVENALRTELEATIRRTYELQEMLEKLEAEKAELENRSKTVESVLRSKLEAMIHRTMELEGELEKLETEKIGLENEVKGTESVLRAELEAMNDRAVELEQKSENFRSEKVELEEKLANFETEKAELEDKLEKLEIEKSELEANESKRGESVLRAELAMIHQKAELEEKLEKLEAEKAELEAALTKSRKRAEASQNQLTEAELKIEALQKELNIAQESKQAIEYQLVSVEAESRTVSAKVSLLEEEVRRERASSEEIAVKCRELEEELSVEKEEVKLRQNVLSIPENKIKQEDLNLPAGKLAECQKTIASLGNQLKSLATLEDFLIDAASLPEFPTGAQLNPRTGEQWRLHSNQTFSPRRDFAPSKIGGDLNTPLHSLSKSHENVSPHSSSLSASSTSAVVVSSSVGSDKNWNGFAKFFSRTKSGIRLEI